jgi:hypothetical protein
MLGAAFAMGTRKPHKGRITSVTVLKRERIEQTSALF